MTPIQIRSALQQQYTEHLDQQIYQEIHKLVAHSNHINYYNVVELYKSLTPFVDLVHQTIRIQTSYFTDQQLEALADTALSNNMTMIKVVENVDFKNFGANENDILKQSPATKLDLISTVVFDAFNQTFIWVTPNEVKQASVDRLIKYFNRKKDPSMPDLKFEFRKFPKIKRLEEEEKGYHKSHKDSLIDCIRKGQIFNISEKLDGTNCGIEIIKTNKDDFQYKLLTHNYYIGDIDTSGNPIEDMRGFKAHAETILIPKLKTWLQNTKQCHIYLYGEWLVSHLVQYQDHMWNHWYLFSIYDALDNSEYALPDRQMVAEEIGLDMPEVFFDSDQPKITPDWLKSYVGKSNDTLDHTDGEGIVVECAGRRAKIRVDQFREVKRIKKASKPMTPSQKFIAETLTDARAHKMILKFRDENRLPEAIDFNHFGQIAKPLGQALWNDIMEEEADNLPVDFDEKEARKALNKKVPTYVKELIFKTEGQGNNFQL